MVAASSANRNAASAAQPAACPAIQATAPAVARLIAVVPARALKRHQEVAARRFGSGPRAQTANATSHLVATFAEWQAREMPHAWPWPAVAPKEPERGAKTTKCPPLDLQAPPLLTVPARAVVLPAKPLPSPQQGQARLSAQGRNVHPVSTSARTAHRGKAQPAQSGRPCCEVGTLLWQVHRNCVGWAPEETPDRRCQLKRRRSACPLLSTCGEAAPVTPSPGARPRGSRTGLLVAAL
jgi:hypothetical protein